MSTCNVGDRTKADRCLAVAGRSDVVRDLAMLNVTRPGTRSALLHYVSCPILRTPGPASTPRSGALFLRRVFDDCQAGKADVAMKRDCFLVATPSRWRCAFSGGRKGASEERRLSRQNDRYVKGALQPNDRRFSPMQSGSNVRNQTV
jgi:hypothetical protein